MTDIFTRFSEAVKEELGIVPRKYQVHVSRELMRLIDEGRKLTVVSLPTGSGKTLIEMFTAFYALSKGAGRVLVLEPTRFLCDQMSSRGGRGGPWVRLFGSMVGKEYEGNCRSFADPSKKIVVSTPQTALKCSELLKTRFKVVVIDEVHHAFGGKHYAELLTELEPDTVVGFTALLPTRKLYELDPRIEGIIGEPHLLVYDFRRLRDIDPDFEPPKAVVDLLDAELNEVENRAYDKLFRSLVTGSPAILKFLEITLARYGKEAFCESYRRALSKKRILPDNDLNTLCHVDEPSHKARALIDALTIYNAKENEGLKPVLIFTSRKATAEEFKEVITNHRGIPPGKVEILTSDMSKEERLKLVRRAREGEVDIIVSTLVGEEGIDIPEAGLLVMTDVPRSPLRFYQRLGRLIRVSSPQRMKYLIVSLSPGTIEYYDLEEALWRLYAEGVDVSYILVNIERKGPSTRVLNTLNAFAKIYNDVSVPYTLLALGRELGDPLNFIINIIKSRKDYVKILQEVAEKELKQRIRTEEELEEAVFRILTFFMLRNEDVRKVLKPLDDAVKRSRFEKEFTQAVKEGKILYIYDVDTLADIISRRLHELYGMCLASGKKVASDVFFRIDRKSLLRLLTRAFPRDNMDIVLSKLKARLERCEKYLRAMGGGQDNLILKSESYNPQAKSLTSQLGIRVRLGDVSIWLEAQINYYDISEETRKEFIKLMNMNLKAAGCEALVKFLEKLHEDTVQWTT